jgi:hypothetical protein
MKLKLIVLSLVLTAGVVWADVEYKDSKQMSYTVPSGGTLIIDNITGAIRVAARPGREVKVAIQEHWTADTQDKLAEGRKEVRVDATQEAGTVKLYVNGPFRCCWDCCNSENRWRGDRGYSVRYDFDVTVPPDTALELKTVNGGGISAEGTRRGFQVSNVNGSIDLTDVAGAGRVQTVNGRVHVSFAENPAAPLSFKTINGEVAVEFQPNLSGDFRFKTMNGEAFTDFDVAALPSEVMQVERGGGKLRYKLNHFSGVRIGAGGGPEHRFETLNGNIRILRRGK